MNMVTTITTKGQVTIPEFVRTALMAKVGDKVAFSNISFKERVAVIKVIPKSIVEELAGSLSSKVKESNYKKARKEAGKMLLKKYGLS